MFAAKQLVALVAILSSVNAACVPRGSGSGSAPGSGSGSGAGSQTSSSSVKVPAYTSNAATSSAAPAAPTSVVASSPAAQDVATTTSSTSVATASSSTAAAVAAAATGSASSSTSSSSSSSGDTKYMVVFGDSYSSTGFYIEGDKPSASTPMGDGSTTTTGGLNWVGYATEQYNTSLVLTYDFAYYGADVSNDIINTGVTTDVVAQVADFEANLVPAPTTAPWTADNLLVAVWIGINDVGECFWESAEYATCPIGDVMTKYFSLMQNLYDDGVRNFVVNTVPPFYKAPIFASQTDLSGLEANLESYNAQLVSNMAAFKANNSDIALGQVFNTTSYFWQVLDDPTSYGLESDITAANADGTSAVWYDDYHPGQAIHKLVAKGFVDALTGSFF